MAVRILIGENEDVKELAQEYPREAAVIEEMLKAAESEDSADIETGEEGEEESVSS